MWAVGEGNGDHPSLMLGTLRCTLCGGWLSMKGDVLQDHTLGRSIKQTEGSHGRSLCVRFSERKNRSPTAVQLHVVACRRRLLELQVWGRRHCGRSVALDPTVMAGRFPASPAVAFCCLLLHFRSVHPD